MIFRSNMKTYLQKDGDGDKLIELVEKREYDGLSLLAHELASLRAEDMATINDLRRQLQGTVKRMESVSNHEIWTAYKDHPAIWAAEALEAVRARLIQAAKGES